MKTNRRLRRIGGPFGRAAALVAVAALTTTAVAATADEAAATPRPAVTAVATVATPAPVAEVPPPAPSYDFRDCPAIPQGTDPSRWRCEVLTADGSLTMGDVTLPSLSTITLTHAEGPMPDGTDGQVWGGLRSGATAVPGGLTGAPAADRLPQLGLFLRPVYGGTSDFYSDGDDLGMFTLRFRLESPLLPRTCEIGAGTPVTFRLRRAGGSTWLSTDPPLIQFTAYDDAFTVPAAQGCGPLDRLVDHRLGLPASSGNALSYIADYTFKTYAQLDAGA